MPRLAKHLSLILTLALAAGCVTTSKKKRKSELSLGKKKAAAPLTMEEVAEEDSTAPGPKSKSKSKAKNLKTVATAPAAPQPTAAELQSCSDALAKVQVPYRALSKLLVPGSYAPTSSALDQLLVADLKTCYDLNQRDVTLKTLADALGNHSGRIGVILPLSGARAKFANFVLQGMRQAFAEAGVNFDQSVVLKDSQGVAKTAETRLAELVFKDRVMLVVGGLDKGEADALAPWSEGLQVPMMLMTRDRDVTAKSSFAFTLYPDEKRLADTLAQAAQKRSYRRVAILRPAGGKSDKVAEYFKKDVLAQGGTVNYDLVYTPGNFDSMQAVSRELFKTEAAERSEEWRTAYRRARKQAEKEHVPFDPRMVVLKPIVDFDAVFIPDDFRTVRHFAKLFKFHMVDHLPLIGNHEWRSPALIDPYEDFLDGSIFADFIGSYAKLPAQVSAPTLSSPYFVAPQNVVQVDFQLIGYRAGKAARMATGNKQIARRQLPQAMLALKSDGAGFMGNGNVFDAERHGNWPTYLFSVTKSGLVLEQEATAMVSTK